MSMSAYVYRLSLTHARLQEAIRSELKHRFPDSLRVARLKKLRLAIKDRIAHIRTARTGDRRSLA